LDKGAVQARAGPLDQFDILPARAEEPVERLGPGRYPPVLDARDRRLRHARPPAELTLGQSGAETSLEQDRTRIHASDDIENDISRVSS
jgi:hypothetical protein